MSHLKRNAVPLLMVALLAAPGTKAAEPDSGTSDRCGEDEGQRLSTRIDNCASDSPHQSVERKTEETDGTAEERCIEEKKFRVAGVWVYHRRCVDEGAKQD